MKKICRTLWHVCLLMLLGFAGSGCVLAAEMAPLVIGLTGEFGVPGSYAAQSVEKGITLAIDEVNAAGGVLGGRKLILESRDDRGVPARGIDNFSEFAARPEVVAVFGSRFSPVVIEIAPLALRYGLPLLAPWSAADTITHQPRPNYVFRLSMTDSWAMNVLLDQARKRRFRSVALFVPNTAWGRSNETALLAYVKQHGGPDHHTYWHNWGDVDFSRHLRQARADGAQAVVMIANEFEGENIVRQMAALPPNERLPILSHWGVLGGDFAKGVGNALDVVDFSIVYTFSFADAKSAKAHAVAADVKHRFNLDVRDMRAQVGFAHAYDLTHLLAKAINKAGSANRAAIREALERLGSHDGLVRRYQRPFTPDRHEALDLRDVLVGQFDKDGNLRTR